MNQTRKKIGRVQRLREIEQSKLNMLAVELSEIELRLSNHSRQLLHLQSQIASVTAPVGGIVVDTLHQTSQWVQYIQFYSDLLRQKIAEIEIERDESLQRVIQQKSTVRGWESLLDRLRGDAVVATEKLESLAADDRFLISRGTR